MFKKLIVMVVGSCARHPWRVLLTAAALSAASAYYVAENFALNTDITTLISKNLPWREREVAYAKEFSSQFTTILAVIDGPTPELTGDAAERLTDRLNREHGIIRSAQQLSGGPFFERNGLLFLSTSELRETLGQLAKSGALLEPLAADPSLRGVMSAISLTFRGVQFHRITLDSLAPQFNAFSSAVETVLGDRPAYFSWRELLSGQASSQRDTRQFIEINPILDYNSLEPGEAATNAIHAMAADLNLAADGVTVRLTGSVPISDDEFATLKEGAALNGTLTLLAVLVILWLALRSARIITAVFVSLFAGLTVTAA